MKVAVIGGGTAGYMAAAHITKNFPQFDLYHIYDSGIPTIGVGEGTQAHFPGWLESITGLDFAKIKTQCNITQKYGIQFENWGEINPQFMHNFYPPKSAYGYHISADRLVQLLTKYVRATHLDKNVIATDSNGISVQVKFVDGTQEKFDFVFDARGFPKSLDDENHYSISLIPTNSALIRRGVVVDFNTATRTVARPYGWIFIIPLSTHTSYGYIYNNSLNSRAEIEVDFDEFIQEEAVELMEGEKHLTFPNFTCTDFFDGALFKIGNKASFLEPLEATAIGITHAQISYASLYPLQELAQTNGKERISFDPDKIKAFNQFLFNTILKIVLFVSWHYKCGSRFDTEFWRFAKDNFESELAKINNPYVLQEFEKYLQHGANFDFGQYFSASHSTFAGITTSSFYEVGSGIGYFSGKN